MNHICHLKCMHRIVHGNIIIMPQTTKFYALLIAIVSIFNTIFNADNDDNAFVADVAVK